MKQTCNGCKAIRHNKGECWCLLNFKTFRSKPQELCSKPLTDIELHNQLERGHGNYSEYYRKMLNR